MKACNKPAVQKQMQRLNDSSGMKKKKQQQKKKKDLRDNVEWDALRPLK